MEGCDLKYSDGYGIGKQSEWWDGILPKEEGCNV